MIAKARPAEKPLSLTGLFAVLGAQSGVKGVRASSTRATGLALLTLFALGALALFAAPAFAAGPEAPEALKPEPIKATSATLQGIVNPLIVAATEPGTYQFEYKATSTATKAECESVGASKAPASPGMYFGLGPEPESEPVTGLTEGTRYVVCLAATTVGGTTVGAPYPFQTGLKLETPVNAKVKAGSVTATSAVVEGELNPGKERKTDQGYYEVLYTVSALSAPPTGECEESATPFQSTSGVKEEKVSETLTGLEPNTKYTFCLRVGNEDGETKTGAPVAFTTPPAPATVDHEGVSNVKATEATLEGVVNPNNQLTECHFQYGTLGVSEHEVPCTPETLKGFGEQVVSPTRTEVVEGNLVTVPVPITGLTANTVYHYRIFAKNGSGEVQAGSEETFTTSIPPETPVELKTVSAATTEVTLAGVLNPLAAGNPGSFELRYRQSATECQGGTPGQEQATPASPASGNEKEAVQTVVTNLQPGATYTFCLLAKNAAEEVSAPSLPLTVTTLPVKPTLTAEEATNLTATTADLTAQVDPNGAEVTTCEFQYGTEAGVYPNSAACSPEPGSGTTAVPVTGHATGLEPDITYHWRLTATNTAGTSTGVDHTFLYDNTATSALPDSRAYEMVTPPHKNGALTVQAPLATPAQISADGDHVISRTVQCFDESLSCVVAGRKGVGVPYLYSRTASGWTTTPMAPPASRFETDTAWADSAETQTAMFGMPTAPFGEVDLYGRGPEGAFTDLGPFSPPADGETNNTDLILTGNFAGSADLSHFVFESAPMWPFSETNSTRAQGTPNSSLFQYPNAGKPEPALVGVSGGLGNTDLISECGTQLGGVGGSDSADAESGDGRIVYFEASGANGGPCPGTGANTGMSVSALEVFARVDGGEADAKTVALSEPDAPQVHDEPNDECVEATCITNTEQPANLAETNPNWREASYISTSGDGKNALFKTEQQLTDGASEIPGSTNLYMYDMSAPEGHRWVDVSAGEGGKPATGGPRVQGVLAYSNDGSHVYFVAQGVLTKAANAQGQSAGEDEDNLYLFERDCPAGEPGCAHPATRTVFIAALSEADVNSLSGTNKPSAVANVTPTGRFLLFTSPVPLTPDVTRTDGALQAYLYDAQTGRLQHVSIGERGYNDDGNAGAGNVFIVPGHYGYFTLGEPRQDPSMSEDGSRVFFMSPVALTPKALNDVVVGSHERGGKQVPEYSQNVYEWEREGNGSCPAGSSEGCVFLISDGHDTAVTGTPEDCEVLSATCLLGTDASGDNVFFATADQLVKGDTDTGVDIYDARVCEPVSGNPCVTEPAAVVPCLGEACHGTPPATPSTLTPGSSTFNGAPNATPAALPPSKPKPLTNAQKLTKALKACRTKHNKHNRQVCEKQARKKYGAKATAKKSSRPTNDRRASR